MTSAPIHRAVVFGATGYVGTHICHALGTDGYTVTRVARREPRDLTGIDFVELNLTAATPDTVSRLVDSVRPTVVVNTVGSIWGRSDDQMWSAAASPVTTLVSGLRAAKHRPWLIHLGSVLEYGTIKTGQRAGAERQVARPTSAYGVAKLAATETVLDAVSEGHIDAMVLRIANVSGPGSPDISLLGQVARQLADATISGSAATVTLDPLNAYRDYVDVRDVADAVVAAAQSGVNGSVVDIGRGEAVPVRHLVQTLLEVSGTVATLVERDAVHAVGRPNWTEVDITPAHDQLGWAPRRSLRRSVEDFWLDTISEPDTTSTEDKP